MSDENKYPSQLAERFQIRLPPGLRDRIKTYAEAHGRSMNTEIVRILEREFPEPWSMSDRIFELVEMAKALNAGKDNDGAVERFASIVQETVEGISSGRIRGVDEKTQAIIANQWGEYQYEMAKYDDYNMSLDPEEELSLQKSGTTAKFVWPDGYIGPKESGSANKATIRNENPDKSDEEPFDK